jgi:hypothetical protein
VSRVVYIFKFWSFWLALSHILLNVIHDTKACAGFVMQNKPQTWCTTISPGFITLDRVAHDMCYAMIQSCNLSLPASPRAFPSIGWNCSCRNRAWRIKANAAVLVCLEGNKARSTIRLAKLQTPLVEKKTTYAMRIRGILVDSKKFLVNCQKIS